MTWSPSLSTNNFQGCSNFKLNCSKFMKFKWKNEQNCNALSNSVKEEMDKWWSPGANRISIDKFMNIIWALTKRLTFKVLNTQPNQEFSTSKLNLKIGVASSNTHCMSNPSQTCKVLSTNLFPFSEITLFCNIELSVWILNTPNSKYNFSLWF